MLKQFKTNQIPEQLKKLQKPGYYILDNTTRKVYILPNGVPAVFKLKEEAEKYISENNINGIVK
jgi:hypothetical protein